MLNSSLDTTIVPGKVVNNGILQGDKKDPALTRATISAHLPVFSGVFPKGPVTGKTHYLKIASVNSIYGSISDPDSPYYGPLSVALQALKDGGQSTIGIRSLSGNDILSRLTVSVKLTKKSITRYKRDETGGLEVNDEGELEEDLDTPNISKTGLSLDLMVNEHIFDSEVGSMKVTNGIDENGNQYYIYPIAEFVGGIGEFYNNNGINFGVSETTNFEKIASIVESNCVYPFYFKMFAVNENGVKVANQTKAGSDNTTFYFFDFSNKYGTKFGPRVFMQNWLGDTTSGTKVVKDLSVNDIYLYEDNIEEVCLTMYGIEKQHEDNNLVTGDFESPHRQMNFLTCVDHEGKPYYNIEAERNTSKFKTLTNLMLEGGISKFKDNEGNWLVDPKTPKTPPLLDAPVDGVAEIFDRECGWNASQRLILQDLISYGNSLELLNVTKDRQSVWWDLGYNEDIKDAAIEMYAKRKDMIIIMSPSIYGETMEQDDYYSMALSINNKLLNYAESDTYGVNQLRSSIELWTAKVIDEPTGDYFTTSMDLMYKFARCAGNESGYIYDKPFITDRTERKLYYMYDPLVSFESDDISANNFLKGCITLRDYDFNGSVYRPALPTTFTDTNSVLKDLPNVFIDVCIEKVLVDLWAEICGTPGNKETYIAFIKNEGENIIQSRFGSVLSQPAVVVPKYYEYTDNGDSILYTTVHVPHNKASYMMDLTLIAYNGDNFDASVINSDSE